MGNSKSKQVQLIPQNPPPEYAEENDIFRFVGRWYDIAGIPTFYTSGVKNINSTYSLNFDGSIKIQTSLTRWGINFKTQFTAISTNSKNTRLKIILYGLFNIVHIYRIVMIGEDYQYFVMSDQKYEELYIFYRQPQMPIDLYEKILRELKENKSYKIDKILKVIQKSNK